MDFKVDVDVSAMGRFVEFSERRVRAAVATALTRTSVTGRRAWQGELRDKLDRPTPYTINAVRSTGAQADALEATISLRAAGDTAVGAISPSEYLGTQQRGGDRNLRKFERALIAKGAMPPGHKVVPARFALVDAYGNITRGQIVQVLNQLAGSLSGGYGQVVSRSAAGRARATRRAGRNYVALPRPLPGLFSGIWERRGDALVPVFRFVRQTTYRQRIDLYRVAEETVRQELPREFSRALRESAARMVAARK